MLFIQGATPNCQTIDRQIGILRPTLLLHLVPIDKCQVKKHYADLDMFGLKRHCVDLEKILKFRIFIFTV